MIQDDNEGLSGDGIDQVLCESAEKEEESTDENKAHKPSFTLNAVLKIILQHAVDESYYSDSIVKIRLNNN